MGIEGRREGEEVEGGRGRDGGGKLELTEALCRSLSCQTTRGAAELLPMTMRPLPILSSCLSSVYAFLAHFQHHSYCFFTFLRGSVGPRCETTPSHSAIGRNP